MPNALVLFTKAPLAGRVKTRLMPLLSGNEAAEFHLACVCDTWEKLLQVGEASLYCYSDRAWEEFEPPAAPAQLALQVGSDLGARMYQCFADLRERGHSRSLIVGSDSPTLPLSYVEQGLEALEHSDVVVGPSEDGGYYAIGCREPHPAMFAGVPWSSADTLQRTEESLAALGLRVHHLPPWYDVDTASDLRRLAAEDSLPPRVGRWMAAHRWLLEE